jgi:hypothetical protein
MNDLQFFNTPAIASVDGSGFASVIQGSSVNDLRAYRLGGLVPSGWPKFTGGWDVDTAAIGGFGTTDGTVDVAMMTRDGNLFVWHTTGPICQPTEWPKYQHDLHNSGNYGTDATPPGVLRSVSIGPGAVVSFLASGDDGYCGRAASYRVTVDGTPVRPGLLPAPAAAGTRQRVALPGIFIGHHTLVLQAIDAAGNLGIPVTVKT